ncbi:sperm flagellar protein 1-like [Ylistrum balloti]|uniref:sperm flagellar protein 1-like n=1 Tax=Ylistrum balloti TaxID=509963 RepID=UPI002905A2B8|nr:sperm flagellar protein 1-like [Ylistrum balloti]
MNSTEEQLKSLYEWIDSIPLSKPKRKIERDFADGVQVAEIVKFFFPKMVEVNQYSPCSKESQKMENWKYLNRKVFKKLRFELGDDVIRDVANCKPGVIEGVLSKLRLKIDQVLWHMKNNPRRESDKPEADQMYDSPQRKLTYRHTSPRRGSEPIVHQQMSTVGKPHPKVPVFSGGAENSTVSHLMFQLKEQECLTKNEAILILNAKIERLEHLLHLKDIRIEALEERLDREKKMATKF